MVEKLHHWNPYKFLFGILVFISLSIFNPFEFDPIAVKTLAIAGLMVTWWITETFSLSVVALLPIILFPLMGIMPLDETVVPYANPIIFLFMGGFMIGLAIEKWDLHKRIAIRIIHITGTSGNRIILGFIIATAFLSMWLSNTATTMMMFPIALSVIQVMEGRKSTEGNLKNFSLVLMLALAFSANIGGIATIIGTPPNVAFVAFINKRYGYQVQFSDWIMLFLPLSILLLGIVYFLLVKVVYPNRIKENEETGAVITNELNRLGKTSVSEKRVLIIFVCTALLWISKDLINKLGVIKLDDTMIAVAGAFSLFVVPSGAPQRKKNTLLDWNDTSKMAWGILILFGGGITLANALEKTGVIGRLGAWMAGFTDYPLLLLILIIATVSIFLSEIMSNIAQVIVFAPVIGALADNLGADPLILGIPMTLAASCAAMFPMGTPPNAIVFSSGHIQLKQMLKTGLIINIVSIVLITLFCRYLLPKLIYLL